jgi:hypothetical protein
MQRPGSRARVMQFSVHVGQREVLASGIVLLGSEDRDVAFNLDGMHFTVRLVPEGPAATVEFVRQDLKHMRIELHGPLPALSQTWRMTGVANAGDRQIDLDVMVYSQVEAADSVRQISFCFTARPSPSAGR